MPPALLAAKFLELLMFEKVGEYLSLLPELIKAFYP
jgi:hypothetical protein